MKKKTLILSICLLLGAFLLPSCDKDDSIPDPPRTKENTWYWGYFKGVVNGKSVSVENEKDKDFHVRTIKTGINNVEDVIPDSINGMATSIAYSDSSVIGLILYELTKGERHITLPIAANPYESAIRIRIVDGEKQILYIPKDENPFRVEITDVIWLSPDQPIVEAELDGTLYRSDNPQDSIVVKGTYGTR